MCESTDWLDTQTQAMLAPSPPEKLAPPTIGGFSLILLERGSNRPRVYESLRKIVDDPGALPQRCPLVVRTGLTLADAYLGQFELICSDSISIFLDDEIPRGATPEYLKTLFTGLRRSPEFRMVTVQVESVPLDTQGSAFLKQFVGSPPILPIGLRVSRKKARIMQYWANKLGARVTIVVP